MLIAGGYACAAGLPGLRGNAAPWQHAFPAAGQSLSTGDAAFLESHRVSYQGIIAARRARASFYADIGVDETITRLGQDPVDYGIDGWTLTPALMHRFGLADVEADAAYASAAYIQRQFVFRFVLRGQLISFTTDANGVLAAAVVRGAGASPK